jgi:uncharacterized membrane protein
MFCLFFEHWLTNEKGIMSMSLLSVFDVNMLMEYKLEYVKVKS